MEKDYFSSDVGTAWEYEINCYPCYRENGGYKIVDGIIIKPWVKIKVYGNESWGAKILNIYYKCSTLYNGDNLSASSTNTYITDSTNLPTYDYYGVKQLTVSLVG